jgi:hypothetical protein
MNRLLTYEEFSTLEQKAKFLAESGQRSIHGNELNKFKFQCNSLKSNLPDNVRHLLSELCSMVEAAFGRVREKEHWLGCLNQTLYKIKNHGVEKDGDRKQTNHDQ